MGELRVRVNEQTYALACGDGEEERVSALAEYLDGHVQKLSGEIGRVAESRLLMLAALNICDELFAAREQLASVRTKAGTDTDDPDWASAANAAEALAKRLEGSKAAS